MSAILDTVPFDIPDSVSSVLGQSDAFAGRGSDEARCPEPANAESRARRDTVASPYRNDVVDVPPAPPGSLRESLARAGYDGLREINHGGQGVVYEATQRSTKRKVAIKVMHEGMVHFPRGAEAIQA